MRVPYTELDQHHRGCPLSEATACPPSVADTIMRTIEVGITDAAVGGPAIPRCPDCEHDGRYRDIVTRAVDRSAGGRLPAVLRVAVPRYRCTSVECGPAVFNQKPGQRGRAAFAN